MSEVQLKSFTSLVIFINPQYIHGNFFSVKGDAVKLQKHHLEILLQFVPGSAIFLIDWVDYKRIWHRFRCAMTSFSDQFMSKGNNTVGVNYWLSRVTILLSHVAWSKKGVFEVIQLLPSYEMKAVNPRLLFFRSHKYWIS